MNSILDSIFSFYMESWGWLIFALLTLLLLLFVFADAQRREIRVTPWLILLLLCLISGLPAMFYNLGGNEPTEQLRDARFVIFTVGMIGGIVPIFLTIGYWITYKDIDNQPAFVRQEPKIEVADPESIDNLVTVFEPVDPSALPLSSEHQAITAEAQPHPEFIETDAVTEMQSPSNPSKLIGAEIAPAWFVDVRTKQTYQLLHNNRTSFGSDNSNLHQITDRGISAKHLVIIEHNKQFFVQDIGSKFGTLLNGADLTEQAVLYDGDMLTIGDTVLQFVSSEE